MRAGRGARAVLGALALLLLVHSPANGGQRFRLNSQQDKIEEAPVEDVPLGDAARAAAKTSSSVSSVRCRLSGAWSVPARPSRSAPGWGPAWRWA